MFVHLRCHSSYSLLSGALRVEQMAQLCQQHDMPALALTDCGNLFGALEFSEELSKAGVQPIIGCSLPFVFNVRDKPVEANVAALAKDEQGYRNLMMLSELASRNGQRLEASHLQTYHQGLILLTGGFDGPLHRLVLAERMDEARELLQHWRHLFPNRLYVELQRHDMREEKKVEPFLLEQALALNLPVVATHEPYFLDPSYHEASDVLWAIAQGVHVEDANRQRITNRHYFTSPAEMVHLFADIPEAIENTIEIARRIGFRPMPSSPFLPHFFSHKEDDTLLREHAQAGLVKRLGSCVPDAYLERLDYELDIIIRMKFAGYFLIVSDFILWAKGRGIPVGPGRGSGAGSLVAWCLFITDLDPMRFGLLFERFLNPERISLPDFDIDFCQERRDEVITYVRQRYGDERVAHIITFGKLQARAVLRDVGRVLGLPYGQVDRICKLVPFNPTHPLTLQESIDAEPRLQQERDADSTVAKLIEISLKLEGLYRHASIHAAGVVIGHRPLRDMIPLYVDVRSNLITTQFSMKWVEKAGLVKFDFLGLKTLSVIAKTCALLQQNGITIDIVNLPLDDAPTFALLARGETMGIFQLENASVRDFLKKMKPDRLEDIIALVALNRPGPMDNIPRYINCKNGLEQPHYMHEKVRPILEETYGIIVYQEQVMQIAQVLAGYTPGEADILRRAMGKKNQEEMDAQRERFIQGAQANQITSKQATSIFELVNKFAGYGFNKSHAAAYGMISYQTAYLKANYPLAFMAASMTLDMSHVEKLALHRDEMMRLDLILQPPDVNASGVEFVMTMPNILHYGLGAIKNVGAQAMEKLVQVRQCGGPFRDMFDFLERCGKVLNKKNLESLIYAGALDSLSDNRAQLIAHIDILLRYAGGQQQQETTNQMTLFDWNATTQKPVLDPTPPFTPMQALGHEFSAIGFYLSNHPLVVYADKLSAYGQEITTYAHLLEVRVASAQLAGVITQVRLRKSRQGGSYAFVTLSDTTGQFELAIFGHIFDAAREFLVEGALWLVQVDIDWSNLNGGEDGNSDSGNGNEMGDGAPKPKLRVVHVRDLRRLFDDPAAAVHSPSQALSTIAIPSSKKQGVRVTLSHQSEASFLRRHLKGNGHYTVYVILPPVQIEEQPYHIELLLGHAFDVAGLVQAAREGSIQCVEIDC